MAHMGATIELPKQSAKQAGFGPALGLAALLAVIGFVIVMAWLIGSNQATGTAVADHSYDRIEGLRGAATLSATDTSVTTAESIRGGAFAPSVVLDRNLDGIEELRGGAFLPSKLVDDSVGLRGWAYQPPTDYNGSWLQTGVGLRGWSYQPPTDYNGSWLTVDSDRDLLDALKAGEFLPQRMPPLSGDGVRPIQETRGLHGATP